MLVGNLVVRGDGDGDSNAIDRRCGAFSPAILTYSPNIIFARGLDNYFFEPHLLRRRG